MVETMSPMLSEHAFPIEGGEMATLIREHDWGSTSLGPIERWPTSLRTAIGMLIASPVPMVLLWGADGVMIYNDAYSGFAGERHPRLLGSKVREGWAKSLTSTTTSCGLASSGERFLTVTRN